MNASFFKKTGVLFIFLVAVPWASACEVCFGNPEDPQTKGMQAAIITLLVITYVTLVTILGFFIYIFRGRARAMQQASTKT